MTSSEVVFESAAYDIVLTHARDDVPHEACGVLVGRRDGNGRVTDARPVSNVAATPRTRYELDPEETLAVVECAEAAGDDVVGFYHSHPTGPTGPSATDRRQATWTGYLYCIVSLPDGPPVGAWRWTGSAFDRVAVRVVD